MELNNINIYQIFHQIKTYFLQINLSSYQQQQQQYQFNLLIISAALIFYYLGKSSYRKNSIEYKVDKLNKIIQSKQKYKLKEVQANKFINFFKSICLFTFFIGIIIQISLYSKEIITVLRLEIQTFQFPYFKQLVGYIDIQQQRLKLIIHAVFVISMLICWKIIKFYKNNNRESTRKRLNLLIQQQISQLDLFIQSLGHKTLEKIKSKICSEFLQKFNAQQVNKVTNCKNLKCKNQKQMYEKYYDIHRRFICKFFDFKWCDHCLNKRKIYLDLSNKNGKTEFVSEQEKVEYQLNEITIRCNKLKLFFDGYCKSGCGFRYLKFWKSIRQNLKIEKKKLKQ